MKCRFIAVLACMALLATFVSAQQPAENSAQSGAASQAQDSKATDSNARVYVYRYKQFVGKALSPSVYCDDNELARIDNGRFFVVTLPPGNHVFRSNDKQAGIDVDLKAGEKYYVRVEIATGFMKGHGRLVSVAPEQGSYEIKTLKPLDSDKVKDTQHVTLALAGAN